MMLMIEGIRKGRTGRHADAKAVASNDEVQRILAVAAETSFASAEGPSVTFVSLGKRDAPRPIERKQAQGAHARLLQGFVVLPSLLPPAFAVRHGARFGLSYPFGIIKHHDRIALSP